MTEDDMAKVRKVDPRIWIDSKFASLSHSTQRLFLYILTCPQMTPLGAFRASLEGLAAELGDDLESVKDGMSQLIHHGMIKADFEAQIIYSKNFLRYNPPDNPNQARNWANFLDFLPECELLIEILDRAISCCNARFPNENNATDRLVEAKFELSERFGKPFPKPFHGNKEDGEGKDREERKKESTKERKIEEIEREEGEETLPPLKETIRNDCPRKIPASPTQNAHSADEFLLTNEPSVKASEACPMEKIMRIYDKVLAPSLGKVRKLTETRKAKVRKMWHDFYTEDDCQREEDCLSSITRYFKKINSSDFLTGRADKSWKANFDWIINPSNRVKVLEDRYDNRAGRNPFAIAPKTRSERKNGGGWGNPLTEGMEDDSEAILDALAGGFR